ncbi:STAS domain-containing protein [Rhodococcus spelaei]|uniref:STAS domain-containing protein n=1 Tax=Rhodococcus spelaei TaxID=2546320 RepID=A0A541B7K8_9NOCA|nr:STAS domain-containing protein [Rhodococcus spelaei]TQF68309.1 STAS domain-containing protein [Rhodococcus spelaei]
MTAATTLEHRLMAPHPDRPLYRSPDRGGCCHTAVVSVRGDLDATSIEQFRRVLDYAFSTCYHGVVIDLSKADFLSIGAAAQLADAKQRAVRSRLDLVLVSASPAVDHVLLVTGVGRLIGCHSTLRSAVAPLRAGADAPGHSGLSASRFRGTASSE